MKPAYYLAAVLPLTTTTVAKPVAAPEDQSSDLSLPGLLCATLSSLLDALLLKGGPAAASAACSSLIGTTKTISKTVTDVVTSTAVNTIPTTTIITTTESAPAPTTTVIVFSNCGISGFSEGTNAFAVDSSGDSDTFSGCSTECLANDACGSFAFGSSQCLLFNATVETNVLGSVNSPFTFFDRNCPASSDPTALERRAGVLEQFSPRAAPQPAVTAASPGTPGATGSSILPSDSHLASTLCSCLLTAVPTISTTATATATVTTVVKVTTQIVVTEVQTIAPSETPVTIVITTTA